MDLKPLFFSYLVICLIVFSEVLITIRKNSILKLCFLLIIASIFVMNYFSYYQITDKSQLLVVRLTRSIYICSVMLAVIHLVSPKIPKWIMWTSISCVVFLSAMRLYYYPLTKIDRSYGNPVFSVGNEFHKPFDLGRVILFCMLCLVLGIIIYYYRQFVKKRYKDNIYYRQLAGWIISLIAPYLLLVLFGMLGLFRVSSHLVSPYLFSLFSVIILLSILFRPKFLNNAQASLAFIPIEKLPKHTLSTQSFNNIFFYNFYYLNKDASLSQLAEKLETTDTAVRDYLQYEYSLGINDLLNKHRVNYMLELLKDPGNHTFTIEHLSNIAGFPSRSTMYRAFSRFHGGSPSDYIGKINVL